MNLATIRPLLVVVMALLALADWVDAQVSSPSSQVIAAKGVVERLIPGQAHHFNFGLIPTQPAKTLSRGATDRFSVYAGNDGKVFVEGTTGVALVAGVYWYLTNVTGCQVTWGINGTGNQLHLPDVLPPSRNITKNSAVPWRYAWNVCTHSYSAAWWDAQRWQREVDWMALHGINMPLAITGQEYIWYRVFQRYNVTLDDLQAWFTGPAFLAWYRMGNIRKFAGPLSKNWIFQQRDLQKSILQQMRSLGMKPVLPCFAGHVPRLLKQIFPHAKITIPTSKWTVPPFPDEMCCVAWLDPTDPLFTELGQAFIQIQTQEFGTDHLYNCDTFNEEDPPSSRHEYLKNAGAAVVRALKGGDPVGVWVMQGWLFHSAFWSGPGNSIRVKSYLSGIGDDEIIILDLNSESGALAVKFDQYFGKPWVWNMLLNFGGVRGLYGNLSRIAYGPHHDLIANGSTMVGVGITAEAIENNPVMFEILAATFWSDTPIEVTPWLSAYVEQRYGANSTAMQLAWQLLRNAVYSQSEEPYTEIESVPEVLKPNFGAMAGNATEMLWAWEAYVNASVDIPDAPCNGPFQYDLVDIARQSLTMFFSDVHRVLANISFTGSNETEPLVRVAEFMKEIILGIEELLATNPNYLLGTWIRDALALASSKKEAEHFLYNAKNQVTLWGPTGQINDYAAKAWSGLYGDYYFRRWELMLDTLIDVERRGADWDDKAYKQQLLELEISWCSNATTYPTHPSGGDALKIASKLHATVTRNSSWIESLFIPVENVVIGSHRSLGLWTAALSQISLLCELNPRCISFDSSGNVALSVDNFRLSPGSTTYLRRESNSLIAIARIQAAGAH